MWYLRNDPGAREKSLETCLLLLYIASKTSLKGLSFLCLCNLGRWL